MECGIVTVDLHGRNTYQAKVTVDALLRRAGAGTYRLRLIHGCHQGTALRDFLQVEYGHHPQVKRLLRSPDGGATDSGAAGNDGMIEEVRLCALR